MSTYHECPIQPHHAGFEMYEMSACDLGDGWADENDLLTECAQNVGPLFELGENDLDGTCIEDIRGRIYGEQGRIFGYEVASDGEPEAHYFAIVELNR
ncbi:MAG: hypothetical protein LLG00_11630 [Planctomycetaceae bacterium]|nr:hypothetical protein [Planctomycetaceae bacterium]